MKNRGNAVFCGERYLQCFDGLVGFRVPCRYGNPGNYGDGTLLPIARSPYLQGPYAWVMQIPS